MKLLTVRLLILVALALGLLACSPETTQADKTPPETEQTPTPPDTPEGQPAGEIVGNGPALWMVSDQDTQIYLFGTVHILHGETQWRSDRFETAWQASPTLFLETDIGPEAQQALSGLMSQIAFNPPGVTLESFFSPEEWQLISDVADELKLPIVSLQAMRPWLASVLISVQMIVAEGGDPEAGVDKLLLTEANNTGKTLRYFETPEQQIHFLADLPDNVSADMLYEGLIYYRDNPNYFNEMVTAWQSGDMDAVAQILLEGLAGPDEFAEVLLYKRNANWADQLADVMENEQGTFFVAVGAGHLVGERSLQHYMAEKGYEAVRQ